MRCDGCGKGVSTAKTLMGEKKRYCRACWESRGRFWEEWKERTPKKKGIKMDKTIWWTLKFIALGMVGLSFFILYMIDWRLILAIVLYDIGNKAAKQGGKRQ